LVKALVDTSVVVDILRAYPPAVAWLNAQTDNIGITHFGWYEVIEGCPNKQKQKAAIRVLERFELELINDDDIEWATTALLKHYLKGNVDAFDCLIAATAHRLHIPLYTRNLKHFTPLLGGLAQKPY
jgi:predicted nucleic acid-binding protein